MTELDLDDKPLLAISDDEFEKFVASGFVEEEGDINQAYKEHNTMEFLKGNSDDCV